MSAGGDGSIDGYHDASMTPRNVLISVISIATFCIFLLLSFVVSSGAQQPAVPPALLGDKYTDLLPEQKALVDDWFRRFGDVVKKTVSPQVGYDNLPVSTKTSFSAITHALIHTTLKDQ